MYTYLFNVVILETFASTMKDVFEQVSMRNVINFIKETHFYNLPYVMFVTYFLL